MGLRGVRRKIKGTGHLKAYDIDDMKDIAEAIKSGEPVENTIGTVKDGFFWFPDEMEWAIKWQVDHDADSPDGYFAMLLDPDIFNDEEDDDEIMAGIEYWWHRSQIYSASYLLNNITLIHTADRDIAQSSLQNLLDMQKEVKNAFKENGVEVGPEAKPKDIWKIVRTTAQYIHNNVRGNH